MSRLREAAQAMIKAWEDGEHIHKHFFCDLRDALAEPGSESEPKYELWGIIMGSPGGRWVTSQVENHKIWPVGTALWVKVGEKK